MFKRDFSDLQRTAVAAVAALILTGISVGAAVGPARAVERGPMLASVSAQSVQANG